jgi:hypothetical protein
MKATIILGALVVSAFLTLGFEPHALAEGVAASQQAPASQDPAWMVLSGASLLLAASLVRRYVP